MKYVQAFGASAAASLIAACSFHSLEAARDAGASDSAAAGAFVLDANWVDGAADDATQVDASAADEPSVDVSRSDDAASVDVTASDGVSALDVSEIDAASLGGAVNELCSDQAGPVTGALPNGFAAVTQPTMPDARFRVSTVSKVIANETDLYLLDANLGILRVSLSDNSVTTVFAPSPDGSDWVQDMAIDDQNIYFNDVGPYGKSYGLAKLPLGASGTPTTLVSNNLPVIRVAVADGYVYYEGYYGSIWRVPSAGGTPTVLLSQGASRGLAVGGGYVYFMGDSGGCCVYLARVPIDAIATDSDSGSGGGFGVGGDAGVGPPGSELIATGGSPAAVGPVADATNAYWAFDGQLMAVAHAGGQTRFLAGGSTIGAIAPATDYVYWSIAGCAPIRKSPIAGGPTIYFVPGVDALSLAVNSQHLYFGIGNGQVFSAPL